MGAAGSTWDSAVGLKPLGLFLYKIRSLINVLHPDPRSPTALKRARRLKFRGEAGAGVTLKVPLEPPRAPGLRGQRQLRLAGAGSDRGSGAGSLLVTTLP